MLDQVRESLDGPYGNTEEASAQKLQYVLGKNPNLKEVRTISAVLKGSVPPFESEVQYTPKNLAAYKFAPLTSCDVERVFSRYKYILTDRRQSALPEPEKAFDFDVLQLS